MKLRDARLKRMADLLSSIRLVKFYAWEEPFTSFIAEIRHREISQQFIANLLDGFMDTLFSSSSSVVKDKCLRNTDTVLVCGIFTSAHATW
ncbi:hypothetical protein HPB48_019841 [Haemaphysalis longicornis]|uniref:Uncharacterized protein n=1 Tax=Haemaphysalis longicornis TaxID=44386 RepID=A0A9J6FD29_HAELO|nr:hypothetical protein HPB48_019841 [Haemaphysalis longicornis]